MVLDPYLYPDSDVLQNLSRIRDRQALDQMIQDASARVFDQLSSAPAVFTVQALADLHRTAFAGLFDWAGTHRTTPLGASGADFARVDLIAPSLEMLLKMSATIGADQADFYDALAYYVSEFYAISPFRAGNAAIIKIHAAQIAQGAGVQIAWDAIGDTLWQRLLDEAFVSLDHSNLAVALEGRANSADISDHARVGLSGLALPPERDPPRGRAYLTPLHKVRSGLEEYLGLARQEAREQLRKAAKDGGPPAAIMFAKQELAYLHHKAGPMLQLALLGALEIRKIRAVIYPGQSPLDHVRELSSGISAALHGIPRARIDPLVARLAEPPCPIGTSPHDERMARLFLKNDREANLCDPRFASLQQQIDAAAATDKGSRIAREREAQAKVAAAALIRRGALSLEQKSARAATPPESNAAA